MSKLIIPIESVDLNITVKDDKVVMKCEGGFVEIHFTPHVLEELSKISNKLKYHQSKISKLIK